MDVQTSLGRIRTQLSGMERMVRILRAELETHIGGHAPGDLDRMTEVPTGLGDLFREARPLAPASVRPYEHFARGVWVGLDHAAGDAGATLALKALPAAMPGASPGDGARVSRLSVNPVFPMAESPRWVTLETAVDIEALKRAVALRIDLTCFFELTAANRAEIPRSLGLTLRLHRRKGEPTDHLNYRVPVSTMPFGHAATMSREEMAGIAFDDVTEAVLILELPRAGVYTLDLDHFALLAQEAE